MIGTEAEIQAANQARQEMTDFIHSAKPTLERAAKERKAKEAKIRRRAEKEQRAYEASLDAELDAEEALIQRQDAEDADEAAETDPRAIIARERQRHAEREQIDRLRRSADLQKIPRLYGVRQQDLAARRQHRADERHAAAERKAKIPQRRERWERRQDEINAACETAITTERERTFHAERAIVAKRKRELAELGEYPSLPREPVRVPRVSLLDAMAEPRDRQRIAESVRELEGGPAIGSPPEQPKAVHPEVAAARERAGRFRKRRRS
jgi:hypothetical protein